MTSSQSVTFSAGVRNSGAVFNGTSSRVEADDDVLQTEEFSTSLWVRFDESGESEVLYDSGGVNRFFVLFRDPSGTMIGQTRTGVGVTVVSSLTVSNSVFHHVVFVRRPGQSLTLFVDGQQTTQPTDMGLVVEDTPHRMGTNSDGANSFTGVLDEVRFYNRALSVEEVAALTAAQ